MLDSKLDDWWLVATIATDKVPSIKGWVPASSLVAKSNDGKTTKFILSNNFVLFFYRNTFAKSRTGNKPFKTVLIQFKGHITIYSHLFGMCVPLFKVRMKGC